MLIFITTCFTHQVFLNIYKVLSRYFRLPEDVLTVYDAIFANQLYFYIRFKVGLQIYNKEFWNKEIASGKLIPTSYEISFLRAQSTSWILGDEGLYSFALERNKTYLIKQSLDGKTRLWNISLSLNNLSVNDLYVSECSSVIYVIHNDSVLSCNAYDGKLSYEWKINPNISTVTCSSDSLFILYQDAKVIQYSSKGTYVFTYQVDNKKIVPKYNQMMIIDGLLNYVLCDQDLQSFSCVNPQIYKWKIIVSGKTSNFVYLRGPKRDGEVDVWDNQQPVSSIRPFKATNLNNLILEQNSYLNVASHLKEGNLLVMYFSGGGNILDLDCPEMIFYTLKINWMNEDSPKLVSMISVPMSSDISYSVSDYSSIVLEINGEPYFVIHGGISCDYRVVYSELFAIRMLEYKYFSLKQNKPFA
jgi:hypothetical protein